MKLRFAIAALVLLGLAACTDSTDVLAVAPPTRLPFGDWGGGQSDVYSSSTATAVSIGCSSGTFSGDVALDPSGRFSVNGTWNGPSGPVRVNGQMPAQLSGQLIGNSLTFAVAVNDTITKQLSSLGPETVVFGRTTVPQPCPL